MEEILFCSRGACCH